MSKDADVEMDSPISKHDLNDVKDDNNIDEPFSGHSSYEINNDNQNIMKTLSYSDLKWVRVGVKYTLHYTKLSNL